MPGEPATPTEASATTARLLAPQTTGETGLRIIAPHVGRRGRRGYNSSHDDLHRVCMTNMEDGKRYSKYFIVDIVK